MVTLWEWWSAQKRFFVIVLITTCMVDSFFVDFFLDWEENVEKGEIPNSLDEICFARALIFLKKSYPRI